jgi:hypothetical protein
MRILTNTVRARRHTRSPAICVSVRPNETAALGFRARMFSLDHQRQRVANFVSDNSEFAKI